MDLFALAMRVVTLGKREAIRDLQEVDAQGGKTSRNLTAQSQLLSKEWTKATRQAALLANGIAMAGTVGGGALQKLVILTGTVAGGFGPQGALVASIGVATLAIVNMFKTARDEMDKTQQEFETNLRKMANARDAIGLEAQARTIYYTGTESGKPEDGLRALREREQKLQSDIETATRQHNVFLYNSAKKALRDVQQKIAPLQKQYDETVSLLLNPFAVPRQRAQEPITTTTTDPKHLADQQQKALEERLQGLIALSGRYSDAAMAIRELMALERQLNVIATDQTKTETERGRAIELVNRALQARIAAEQRLAALAKVPGAPANLNPGGPRIGMLSNAEAEAHERRTQDATARNPGGLTTLLQPLGMETAVNALDDSLKAVVKHLRDFNKDVKAIIADTAKSITETIRTGIGQTLGDTVYNTFASVFDGHNLKGTFNAFSRSIAAGIGSIFADLGKIWIEYGLLMTGLGKALWNPFTSGPAAIAIGTALIALSAALGAAAHGGGGRGTAQAGAYREPRPPEDITRITITQGDAQRMRVNPAQPLIFNIFSPTDPATQRAVKETLTNIARRS